MDEYNESDAVEIVELAKLQFLEQEIAQIMEMDESVLINIYSKDILRGRLLAEAEVRRAILQLAKQGSTPAQKQFLELNRATKKHELSIDLNK